MSDTQQFRDSELWNEYHSRVQSSAGPDRRLSIIVVARNAATGVGKTTAAVSLCHAFDPDWSAHDRATLDPREYLQMYRTLPPKSAVLFDEVGAAMDNRRSSSSVNLDISHDLQTLRVRQITTCFTVPSPDVIDKRLKMFCDYTVVCHDDEPGLATVYRHDVPVIGSGVGGVEHVETERFRWPELDHDDDFQELDRMKKERYVENETRTYDDDCDDDRDDDQDELTKQQRNLAIRRMVENGATQSDAADAFDLSASAVSRIVND
jgi:hypothetical protein